jgi:putative Holliday junction resolvase
LSETKLLIRTFVPDSGGDNASASEISAPETVALNTRSEVTATQLGVALGIDFGTVRIGVARSNPERTMVLGLTLIDNNAQAISELSQIVSDYQVTEIFFGQALHLNANPSASAERARYFAQILFKSTRIPYSFVDERLSSVEARKNLSQIPGKSHFPKSELDIESARIILLRALKL